MDCKYPTQVCLIRPPISVNIKHVSRYAVPSIGLAYIASATRNAGFPVQVIDAVGEALEQFTPIAGSPNLTLNGLRFDQVFSLIHPDTKVFGVSIMFSRDWLLSRAFLRELKKEFPQAKIVVGGEHVTACADYVLHDCPEIDFVVRGEGEETFTSLLKALVESSDIAAVDGIVYRQREKVIFNRPRNRIQNIDSIPLPAWDLLPIRSYIDNSYNLGFNLGRSMPMLASRGCPFQCTFCSNPQMWTTAWNARSPELVVAEMKQYIWEYQVTNFDFFDLTTIVKKSWIIEFCQLLVKENLNITWQLPSGTRSEALDEEVTSWLYKAGCRSIIYAPESGSPEELKRIKKKVNLDKMLKSMRSTYLNGVRMKVNIVMGFPDATLRDVLNTYWFFVRMAWVGVNDVGCFAFSPYPGSELFHRLRAEKKIELNDAYFISLGEFNSLFDSRSYCDNFPGYQVSIINILGMVIFYSASCLFRPARIWELYSILSGKNTKSSMSTSVMNRRRRKIAAAKLQEQPVAPTVIPAFSDRNSSSTADA